MRVVGCGRHGQACELLEIGDRLRIRDHTVGIGLGSGPVDPKTRNDVRPCHVSVCTSARRA